MPTPTGPNDDETQGPQQLEDDAQPPVADRSRASAERDTATPPPRSEDPHASKIPPDHPGLRIKRPGIRTLRKGPVVAIAITAAGLLSVALIVGLQPPTETKKDHGDEQQPSTLKNFSVPDLIKNAPDNKDPLQIANEAQKVEPKEGKRKQLGDPAGGHAVPAQPSPEHQARVEQLMRARAGGLFFDTPEPQPLMQPLSSTEPGRPGAPPTGSIPKPGMGQDTDQNLQDRKNDFVEKSGIRSTMYASSGVVRPLSPYEVKAGTIIPVTLLTGINSDLPGEIVGQVRENVYDTVSGNYLLIPQGSRVLAKYDSMVAFGQERVLVCWNRLIRPDGSSVNLECMPGVDLAGYSGFADDVDMHWWRLATGVVFSSLLAATAQKSAGNVQGAQPSVGQMWAYSAAGEVNNVGQQLTRKNLAIQPTITVRPGFSVNVLVSKDLVIPPSSPPTAP